jgi:outer membrane protein assembly factor BamB
MSENHIVIRTKEARFFGDVIVLEKESGIKVWDHQDALSNVAVDNGTAYFLTEDMKLLGIEISTGNILVEATIQPKAIDSTNNVYQLTVSHDIVVVYFDGGNQLTAFQVSFAD